MRNIYKYIIALMCLAFVTTKASAQDFHYSQYFNSPLTFNPALTGNINGDFRVSALYRNQWKELNSPYVTSAFSADMNVGKKVFGMDLIGIGLVAVNDELGDGYFKNQHLLASLAMHKYLDRPQKHLLSFGMQGGVYRKNVDQDNFYFENQLTSNYTFDQNIASGERMSGMAQSLFNLNAGMVYRYLITDRSSINAGLATYNITRPNYSFYFGEGDQQLMRYIMNLGLDLPIGAKVNVLPAVMYTTQGKAQELNIGSSLSYTFNPDAEDKPTVLKLGAYYRSEVAAIFLLGLEYKGFQGTFSYDANFTDLTELTEAPDLNSRAYVGSYEIGLRYIGLFGRPVPTKVTVPCKFF